MDQQLPGTVPIIGATYTARVTESIYRHLRGTMKKDDEVHKFIAHIMEDPHSKLPLRPTINNNSQINLPPKPRNRSHRNSSVVSTAPSATLSRPPTHKPSSSQDPPALPPPPPPTPFAYIKMKYDNLKETEYQHFLQHIHHQVERRSCSGTVRSPEECDLQTAKDILRDRVQIVEEFLEKHLSDRGKLFSAPKFNKKDQKRYLVGFLFFIWLGFSIVLFALSTLDDQCSLVIEKHLDWSDPINPSAILSWCFIGVSQNETNAIGQSDPSIVIGYLEYRHWRSSLFFNLSLLVLATLLAKIVSNFASGKPGLAGMRLSGSFSIFCCKGRFKHIDLELAENAMYHVHRYFEDKGIYLPDFTRTYEIDQIYESCRYHPHTPTSPPRTPTTEPPRSVPTSPLSVPSSPTSQAYLVVPGSSSSQGNQSACSNPRPPSTDDEITPLIRDD